MRAAGVVVRQCAVKTRIQTFKCSHVQTFKYSNAQDFDSSIESKQPKKIRSSGGEIASLSHPPCHSFPVYPHSPHSPYPRPSELLPLLCTVGKTTPRRMGTACNMAYYCVLRCAMLYCIVLHRVPLENLGGIAQVLLRRGRAAANSHL